jgi:acetate CoA/acetoacetate CoA-transferase beta subunit
MHVFFQSENGLIGTGAPPEEGMAHPTLTDAGGRPVTALPGASTFDSAMSFGLIRGGHLDLTVLGGLQVDQEGHLANWMIPNKMVPGMGGAMDLVTGAKRVIVAMQHTAKGAAKIVRKCTLPITSMRPVDLVVTELAVVAFREDTPTTPCQRLLADPRTPEAERSKLKALQERLEFLHRPRLRFIDPGLVSDLDEPALHGLMNSV